MRICQNCAAEMNAAPFCVSCGCTVSIVPTRGKDDLNRVLSLYGRPDTDSCAAGGNRTLDYAAAGIRFTFRSEKVENAPLRWNLLIITDMQSHYVVTAHAAAQRLLH